MRVRFEYRKDKSPGPADCDITVDMIAVPRYSENVGIEGINYSVDQVFWDLKPEPGTADVLVRLR